MKKITALITGTVFVVSANAYTSNLTNQEITIQNFSDVEHYVDKLSQTLPPNEICVIYDIDNTLITKERLKTGNPNLCHGIVYVDDTKSKVDMIAKQFKHKLDYYAIYYNYLPNPEDEKNWQPQKWQTASQALDNLVKILN
ncbi:DUF705 domain-containing protein [Facilibium subflavum]|uniref:DUF705 domain-containing protein n=1 Tax=Facilibium subflavum TaxID=2219058 RepID=UPI000E6542E0|nr:DUF705 domain-containing protein [Facilibium subflavum]